MNRGQENGTTILLGLKDYKVEEVWAGEEKVVVEIAVKGKEKCPHRVSGRLRRTWAHFLHPWKVKRSQTLLI